MRGTLVMDLVAPLATVAFIAFGGSTLPLAQTPPPTASQTVELNVTASRFKFEPSRLEVTQGDHVRILLRSADRTHGFSIKKLKITRLVPRDAEPVTIEFDAKEPGSYEIVCSEECGTGHKDMKGLLVVVARTPSALSEIPKSTRSVRTVAEGVQP